MRLSWPAVHSSLQRNARLAKRAMHSERRVIVDMKVLELLFRGSEAW